MNASRPTVRVPSRSFTLARPLRMGEGRGEGALEFARSESCRPVPPFVPSQRVSGVGSRISWVIYLSKIRDPTQPLVFPPSRDCRGSFLPLVKKDPHHRRGSFFVPAGDLFPGDQKLTVRRRPKRILNHQDTKDTKDRATRRAATLLTIGVWLSWCPSCLGGSNLWD
jgi:hypothetical protein